MYMQTYSRRHEYFWLIFWVVICYDASAIGALASLDAPKIYLDLAQPTWAPPSWVFTPVWCLLYVAMGIAAWLVWREGGFRANWKTLTLFLVQLILNAIQSWFFFAWQMAAMAFINLLVLCVLIAVSLVTFYRINHLAGLLLAPYLFWTVFLLVLLYSLLQLNTHLLNI